MDQLNNINLRPAVPALFPNNTYTKINTPSIFEYNPYPPSTQYIGYTNINDNFLESLKFQMMTGCRRYHR